MSKIEDLIATEEGANPKWRSKTRGEMYMKEMDSEYLQTAKLHCQKKKLQLHYEMMLFERLEEQLEEEAAKRGIKLKELNEVKPLVDSNKDFITHTKLFKQRNKELRTEL
jgi:hypothetical protein